MTPPSPRLTRLREGLAHPMAVWAVLLVSLLLGASTLGAGLIGDDLMQAEVLRATVDGTSDARWWDMFVLVNGPRAHNEELRAAGALPWWVAPELRIAFFRPLSVATHVLDYALWPNTLWAMHLHSIAWYVLTCGLVWRVAQRLCSSNSAATLASLVYACAYSHLIPVGWLAHRNAVVSTTFALLALLAHHRWRREAHAPSRYWSALALVGALLAGEGGVVCFAFLFAYALILDEGGLLERLKSLTSSVAVIVAWRLLYSWCDYGASASGAYIDPIADPMAFAAALPVRLSMLGVLSVSPPFIADAQALLWWLAALILAAGALVFVIKERAAAARFGALAALIGCIPLIASFPFERLLVLTSLGLALVWGELLDTWLVAESSRPRARALGLLVVVIHLVISPLQFVSQGLGLNQLQPQTDAITEDLAGKQLVVLHTPNYLAFEYLPELLRAEQSAQPRAIWVLHAGMIEPALQRRNARSLEIEAPLGWPAGPVTEFWRNPHHAAFNEGDVISTQAFTATVELAEEGRAKRTTFEFNLPLDDPSIVWVIWQDGRHRRVYPSAWPSR